MQIYEKTSHIVITIIISIFISFLVFLIFMTFFNPVIIAEQEFFSREFDLEYKKIFLLGSSYVGQIDANIINEFLINEKYKVYNLSIHTDDPTKRIKKINEIIAQKPDLIIYGLSFKDIGNYESKSDSTNFQVLISSIFPIEEFFDIRQNPKDITLDFILNIITYSDFSNRDEFNPIYPQKIPIMSKIQTNEVFEQRFSDKMISTVDHIPIYENNIKVKALEKIIEEIKKNEIEIVLFTTPYNQIYFNHLEKEKLEKFHEILDIISEKNNVSIYNIQKKYAHLDIWADPSHVAYNNNNTRFYSEDIGKIIQNEMEK